MSHLSEQREFFSGLARAAKQVVREINTDAATRQAARPAPKHPPRRQEPIRVENPEPMDSCQCHAVRCAPCSWCTSDDNPLNADPAPSAPEEGRRP